MMPVVKGIAMWASTQKPNTTFTPQWCVDLIVDKETAKLLKKEGLKVKENDDGEFIVKFKRNTVDKNGKARPAPKVVDASKNPITELVGNGSVVNVQYRPFEWSHGGKKGVSGDFCALQVLELKAYKGEDGSEFDAVEDAAAAVNTGSDDDDPFSDES